MERQNLTKTLWSWSICADCTTRRSCLVDCTWREREVDLDRFFQTYKELTARYEADIPQGQQACLNIRADLLGIIEHMKINAGSTRQEITQALSFPGNTDSKDRERAFNLAIRIMLMINCADGPQSSVLLEHASHQIPWGDDTTFDDFFQDAFPKKPVSDITNIVEKLRATELKKAARIDFEPTDDLRNHLRLDSKKQVVQIFHHTAFLKEQLRLTKDQRGDLSAAECLKLGVLPRALVLETLKTLSRVLFRDTEHKEKALLASLTSTRRQNFDPDIVDLTLENICDKSLFDALPYEYFASRLGDLYVEQINPQPRGIERWFERWSKERHIMMATIAGVCFAIFLGFAALLLGGVQVWLAYQQWQHPVKD